MNQKMQNKLPLYELKQLFLYHTQQPIIAKQVYLLYALQGIQ